MQPTTTPSPASSAPAATPASQTAAPTANITRTDGVVGGGSTPVAGGTQSGTLQPSGGGGAVAPAQPQSGGGSMMLIMMLPIAALMIFMFMGNRKETKKRAELMASLQRNDKVQTIGGVIGSIAEINETEVILKVDEITNTRVTVSRSAISSVLNRSSKPGAIKASA